jgi:Tfp pilus assembly protein PilF
MLCTLNGAFERVNRMIENGQLLLLVVLSFTVPLGGPLPGGWAQERGDCHRGDLRFPKTGISVTKLSAQSAPSSHLVQPTHLSRNHSHTQPGLLRFVQWEANNLGRPPSRSSWWSRLLSPFQAGAEKVSSFLKKEFGPRTEPTFKEDAISLSRPAKPSAQLYVALARLAEQQQRFGEAEQYYEKALEISPKDVEALLGYARLKDLANDPESASRLYRRAMEAHPNDPAVHNDWALFLVRRGRPQEAVRAMENAIRLQPRRWLYRNNMAIILVQLAQYEQALNHLLAVQDPATACYNLGYILLKRGDLPQAQQYFLLSLQHNPRFEPAHRGLAMVAEAASNPSGGPPAGEVGMIPPPSEDAIVGEISPTRYYGRRSPPEPFHWPGSSGESFRPHEVPPVPSMPALPPPAISTSPISAAPESSSTF